MKISIRHKCIDSDQCIEKFSKVKHLGLILDEFLNCNTHFILLEQKLNRPVGYFRNFNILTPNNSQLT